MFKSIDKCIYDICINKKCDDLEGEIHLLQLGKIIVKKNHNLRSEHTIIVH